MWRRHALLIGSCLLVCLFSTRVIQSAPAALQGGSPTFIVNTTSDGDDTNPGNSICDSGGQCSLRAAIEEANLFFGTVTINFNIPGAGVHTITPLSPLPALFNPQTIDGTTQPGYSGTPLIALDGSSAGANADGLHISATNTTIEGLIISGFSGNGIVLDSRNHNLIAGNIIGVDAPDSLNAGNNIGVSISNASNNTIGGTTTAARNIISGNVNQGIAILGVFSSGNIIEGNFIGTDAAGSLDLGNGVGVYLENTQNNTIGGTASGAGNLISGSQYEGLLIVGGSGNLVQGNRIGTDAVGSAALGNGWSGVYVQDSPNNTIGGTAAGAGNLISGNASLGGSGVVVYGFDSTGNIIQGNTIGLDQSGVTAVPNDSVGIDVYEGGGNTIGGSAAGAGNTVASNDQQGILLDGGGLPLGGSSITTTALAAPLSRAHQVGSPAARQHAAAETVVRPASTTSAGNIVQGNFIGTNAAGLAGLGNGLNGIMISNASGNSIGGTAAGEGNVIAGNGFGGVFVHGGAGNSILSNSIDNNDQLLGIELFPPGGVNTNDAGDADTGTNDGQNYPILSSATDNGATLVVNGALNSSPNTYERIEFFANDVCDASGYGQGQTLLGAINVLTDASGNASFVVSYPNPATQFVTATATNPNGDTSEFAACSPVAPPAPVTVAPTLLLPANATRLHYPAPTFTWTSVPNATAYEIEVADNSDFTPTVFTASDATTSQTPVISLGADGLYYWHVRGVSSAGDGPWSAPHTFILDTQPISPPTLLTPTDGSSTENRVPTFTWQAVTDAVRYEIRLDTVNPPESDPVSLTVTHYTPPAPLFIGTYYWQVRAIDAAGNVSDWSVPAFALNIISPGYAAPPLNYYTTSTPTFTWSNVSGADHYEVQVSSTLNFSSALNFTASVPADQLWVTTSALDDGTYYWRVRACSSNGFCNGWSSALRFEVHS